MTRHLVIASAALAAAGFVAAASPADAGYVRSGLTQYADAPAVQLTTRDCRAVYDGQVRLVSSEAYAKYLARHPEGAAAVPSRRFNADLSGVELRRSPIGIRDWAGQCGR